MRSAGWLSLLPLGLWVAQGLAGQPKDAKAALDAIVRRYESAKTLVLAGAVTSVTKSPDREVSVTQRFTVHLQRPNKFRIVLESASPQGGKQQQVFVADGRHLFMEFPPLKQVVKRPLDREGQLPPVPFADFLRPSRVLPRVKEVQWEGQEKVGNRVMQRLRVTATDGTVSLLWVADNTIWQMRVTVEGQRLAAQAPTKGEKPNPFLEAMKRTTFTATVKFEKVAFNAPLPSHLFTYKPPPGFKVVERLQMPTAEAPPPGGTPKP